MTARRLLPERRWSCLRGAWQGCAEALLSPKPQTLSPATFGSIRCLFSCNAPPPLGPFPLFPPSSTPAAHGDRDCLTEAKRTASAEVKYDWWGDEEEEEPEQQPEIIEKLRFECPKKCPLQQTRTSSDLYQCNLCGQRLPQHARIYSCRTCDFDGCGLCYSRIKPEDAGNHPWPLDPSAPRALLP